MSQLVIALLGRKDEPTDAVEEYCRYLGSALRSHDFQLEIRRVPWELHGWRDSLRALQLQAAQWRGCWVLVQYTALAWSARGFPSKILYALKILKSSGARVGIVFHDVEPYPGTRLIDRLRRAVQLRTMRRVLSLADLAIFTVPPEKLSWLRRAPSHAAFVPVGPNLPIPPSLPVRHSERSGPAASSAPSAGAPGHAAEESLRDVSSTTWCPDSVPASRQGTASVHPEERRAVPPAVDPRGALAPEGSHPLTVGVFSITGGPAGAEETRVLVAAVRSAAEKLGALRLSVFGRHAELREDDLRRGLRDLPVDLTVEGVLSDQQVVERLCSCDVLLFVRGGISTRRSSAIAGIACGVPMIAYSGPETSWPITDGGVLLVPPHHPEKLKASLIRILSETDLRAGMSLANRMVYRQHFSWSAIAARFATLLTSSISSLIFP